MKERRTITVLVNDALTLDAGWWETIQGDDGALQRVAHPPPRTMYDQLLGYLSGTLKRGAAPTPTMEQEAIAAMAVCSRWGSYLAVLVDRDRPLMDGVDDVLLSRISDSEMARFVCYFAEEKGARFLRNITPAMINDLVHVDRKHLAQVTRHNLLRMIKKVFNALQARLV